MSGRNRFLVAYDVSDPKRLRKVFKKMHGYGDPLQYSVFCCNLSAKERALMLADLDSLIHHDLDRVIIVDLGPQDGRGDECLQFLGRRVPAPQAGPVIV